MQYTPEENTARQEALYSFLLDRGDRWTNMEQVTDSISLYPAFFTTNYHNSSARRLLTGDIETINSSGQYEKIIISGNRGVKLATESEFERFLNAELREIFRKLRRVRKIARKGTLDQQIDFESKTTDAFLEAE